MVMKRILAIIVVAALGALVYVADPPGAPAEETAAPKEMVVASAQSQSMVARLAEASIAMRRNPAPIVGHDAPDPDPDKLFGHK